MITSAIKKQTSFCCSISLNPYDISNLESRKKKRKRIATLLLAYIADVSCLTNRSFYMRTLCVLLIIPLRSSPKGNVLYCIKKTTQSLLIRFIFYYLEHPISAIWCRW